MGVLRDDDVDYDVIVVGAGPAGCAFARSVAAHDPSHRILLIERSRFPRDKICGDALTYEAIPAIRRVFPELAALTPSASATSCQVLIYPARREFTRRGTPLDVIPRLALDGAMWDAVSRMGIERMEGARVTAVLRDEGRVRGVRVSHEGREQTVTSRLLVGADGSQSVVRRSTGPVEADYVIHAVRQYVRGVPDATREHVFLFDLEYRGYFWIFPFLQDGERWANVGYGNSTDSRRLKDRFDAYRRSPEVERYLGAGRLEGRLVGFPLNLARITWRGQPKRPLWGPGYLLLGDAAALIHPLSGEGISFAVESGRIAAEVLLDRRISEDRKGQTYQRRVMKRVRPAFLSIAAYCAIRLPMVLSPPLSRVYVALAWHAHRILTTTAGAVAAVPAHDVLLRAERSALLLLLGALVAFWLGAAVTAAPPASPYGVRAVLFVGLGVVFCFLHARRWQGGRFALMFSTLTLTCSLVAETIGSLTGALFGVYTYGPNIQSRLGGLVPVVIPIAWYVVSYLSYATAAALVGPARASAAPAARSVARATLAASLFVGYDLIADPNHLHRGGWTYPGGGLYFGVPLQNFVAWFLLGLGTFLLVERWRQQDGRMRESRSQSHELGSAVLGYVAVLVHESLYATWLAGHVALSAVGLALALVVFSVWLWRFRPAAKSSPRR